MTFDDFQASLGLTAPPENASPELRVLWYARRGDWDRAHDIAQDMPGADGAWLHAYLHRVEGDAGNAAYWYRRASRPVPRQSLEEEWEELAAYFVKVS